jgi:2-polyprenyl-6-methoxyphenol hydroxylase-like FAD-dependent oxidoreductase
MFVIFMFMDLDEAGPRTKATVIVAGAGPVGLTVAALLDLAGVPVEVFEREHVRGTHSRATTLHPRTLETLDALPVGSDSRVSDLVVARGRRVPRAHFATLPAMLDYTDLPTRYPFVLMVPQPRVEAVLAEYLRDRGVAVHHGHEVTGVEQDSEGVRVSVGDVVHRADFLIGADGAHSVVRKCTGVEFAGVPPTAVGFGADVALAEQPTAPRHHWRTGVGSASIVPLTDTTVRIFGTAARDTGLTPEQVRVRQAEPLTLAELRAVLREVVGDDCGVRGASWLTRSSNTTRHATRYRVGRVLLVGDAAHVHLPAGGQGLNVGVQDAANLAWKLAAEIHGWAPPQVVDGVADYDHERRDIGERLAANTLAQDALMHNFTASGAALRDLFTDLIASGGVVPDLRGWLSGLGLRYPQPDGVAPLVGSRAPDVQVDGDTLPRALRPDRLLLLDFTDRDTFAPLSGPHLDVRSATADGTPWSGHTAALIRPDGYVAHISTAADPDELRAELGDWVTAPVTIG